MPGGLRKGLGWGLGEKGRPRREHLRGPRSEEMRHRSSKDTKRWCKGIEGREHEWHWVEDRLYSELGGRRGENVVCSKMECANCRKYRGPAYSLHNGSSAWNPPEWSSAARLMFEKTPVYHGRYQIWRPHRFYGPAF